MRMLKNWVLLLLLALTLFINNNAVAQTAPATDETVMVEANSSAANVEMADQLRRDGKIYIVVGCVLVVLAGVLFYLVSIDRKVGRLEKQFRN
ncbi:MAG: CcmD family protein [Adhaeribacter sp.]